MKATITTNHGPIVIDLFEHQAPKTLKNLVGLAQGEPDYKGKSRRTTPPPSLYRLSFPPTHPTPTVPGHLPPLHGAAAPEHPSQRHRADREPPEVLAVTVTDVPQ